MAETLQITTQIELLDDNNNEYNEKIKAHPVDSRLKLSKQSVSHWKNNITLVPRRLMRRRWTILDQERNITG